jgi:uncharacterized protein (TIGR00299 family) protein
VKTLYLDIFSGLSGDMFIGAMLDLGMGLEHLERELGKLQTGGYHLHASRARRLQLEGTKFDVHTGHDHSHEQGQEQAHEHAGRSYEEIRRLIAASGLSEWVKTKSTALFKRLAVAEGKLHGIPASEVHFHEVGALDSLVDMVGACVALEFFGRPRVLASEVVDGHGWIECAHGRYPVPAPATLEILSARGVAITQCQEPHEMITPTGAALLAEFVEHFGPMENFTVEHVGLGLGQRDLKSRPNVVRAMLGSAAVAGAHDWETDTVTELQTNLDDANPEWLGHFMDKAMAAGALDVCQTPMQMKKNRPGVLLTVLCELGDADKFTEWILRETSAFGVRRTAAQRRKLRREFRTVATAFGEVTVKIGLLDGAVVQTAPEYESCRKAAEERNVPIKTVYEAAMAAIQ